MKALAVPLRRPIGTGAVYVALLVAGIAAMRGLPLGLAPDLDLPRLDVHLSWPTATPREMEALVTSRVEGEVQRLPDVEEVSSVSGTGWSVVEAAFRRGTDVHHVQVILRDRLAALREDLPPGLAPPEIRRTLPRGMAGGRFLVLQASGPYTAEALRERLEDTVLPRLLSVPGVAGAEIYGGTPRQIRVDLDRSAAERGLVDPGVLSRALDRLGGLRSVGSIRTGGERAQVVVAGAPAEAASVEEARIGLQASRPLRIGDVGRVSDTWAEPVRLSRLNGRPSLQIVLERERGTNVIEVAGRVNATCEELRQALPSGVTLATVYDQSERIRDELGELSRQASLSVLCIFGVLLLFHRTWRAPLVVLGSVVFSALVTFVLFRSAALGMNLVTLSGLALSFGMAVDNSIVLLENIALRQHKSATRGPQPENHRRLRTLAATREVLFPLMAGTLTTAVVLMPFLYLSGDLRDYYVPFALAICLSLTASMAVALTMTPLLARWSLGGRTIPRARLLVRWQRYASTVYGATLSLLLRRPLVPALAATLLLAGSIWIFDTKVARGSIFPPDTDTSLDVAIEFPPGAEIAQTDALISVFEHLALDHPFYEQRYIEQVETYVQERSAHLSVRFHPGVARTTIPQILRELMNRQAAATSGVAISVFGQGPGYSTGGMNISPSYQMVLKGPDYLALSRYTEDLGRRLQRNGRIKNLDMNLSGMLPKDAVALAIVPDRRRMAEMGITIPDLLHAIEPAIASDLATRKLRTAGGEVEARVRHAGGDALTPAALTRSFLSAAPLPPFPLGQVIEIEERPIQAEIHRSDQQYERRIGFEYRGPRKIGNRFVKAIVENTTLPPGYTIEEGSGLFLTRNEEQEILYALAFALVLVYMVSAALFESVVLPFVALLSVPLSFIGIAAVFWMTGETFDRTAYVGLILLTGITINTALLFVHRAGVLVHRSGDPAGAARQAAFERARPILISTITSVAGLLPLAWQSDASTVAGWRSLALASAGGLLASAVFTLLIVPVLFVILTPKRAGHATAAGASAVVAP